MSGNAVLDSIIMIALISLLTFGARVLPFALFSRGGETPKAAVYLGNILPPAVMVLLIVYCLRNVQPLAPPYGIPELIGAGAVVLLYRMTKNNLIAIVGGTALYMFLVQAVFV